MEDQWAQVITTIAAVIALLFGFTKWFMDWAEKRDAEQERHVNLRLDSHNAEFEKLQEQILQVQRDLIDTRERMISDYLKVSSASDFSGKMEKEVSAIHQRLGAISRELSTLIGSLKSMRISGE